MLETLTLRVFTSDTITWAGFDQAVPLSSLSMVAASCPNLHTLELYLYYPFRQGGGQREALENFIQSSQPTDHRLTNLKIVFSDPFAAGGLPADIMEAVTVSRFINHVFPNVQNVDVSEWFGDGSLKEWCSEIKVMMMDYRDVKNAARGGPITAPN
ncbi:hypothetical protein M413DRAFT_24920 [Hebeloma cylindrosporum]|uniref:F-box domain-containing protein n=1 Tax=Hebeloma cylindrosporum TaxID=76867 RepID=A0A0C2Y3I1_HEBCY|nr:hypothetical protein M413DRAFT_24920 [Hebeloma cylindrosporum h7]